MQAASIKKNAFRGLLTLHFIGLALMIGATVANLMINHWAAQTTLQALAFGRDLSGFVTRGVVLPGFLILITTGAAMTLMRYGRRTPLWVVIKIALNAAALAVGARFVAPALVAARYWAEWSVEHNQLASQFQQSASQAACFGAIVFSLLLLNIPVAVWKPVRRSRLIKFDPPDVSLEAPDIRPSVQQRRDELQKHIDFADGDLRRNDNDGSLVSLVREEQS
jgi:hypothetical protein